MTYKNYIVVISCFCLLGSSCKKDNEEFPIGIELPTTIEFGESQIYRNGELIDYERRIYHKTNTIQQDFSYSFFLKQDIVLWHSFKFNWLPADTGFFKIDKPGVMHEVSSTSFTQVISEDLLGYSYDLMDKEDGFIHITHLDTIDMKVKGTFEVKFKRTSKNGNKEDLGLPKYLYFQGIFYDQYKLP